MADLTTLANVKAYLHIPTGDTSNDTFLSNLISQVSARIQWDCQRNFAAADYLEQQNCSTGQTRAQVRNKPVIQINGIAWGYAIAIQITYSGAAVMASANITPARKLILQRYDGTGKHEDTVDLTNVSYSLCSQVVTQINSLGTGWTATLMGGVDVPTRRLYTNVNLTCKTANTAQVQGFGFAPIDSFAYIVDPTYGTVGFQPLSQMDYFFHEEGNVTTPLGFPGMYQGLILDYRGGYETIPGDIDLLSQQIVAEVFNLSQKDTNVQSEALGDYNYTLIDPMLRRQVYADILAPYKRVAIAGGNG